MRHTHPKKAAKPSRTTSLSTPVLGFVTVIICESLGIVSKKFSTCLNCFELNCSRNSANSFLYLKLANLSTALLYFIKLERCEYDVEKMLKTTTKKNLYGGLDFNSIDKFLKDILNIYLY